MPLFICPRRSFLLEGVFPFGCAVICKIEGQVRTVTDSNAADSFKKNVLVKFIKTENLGGHVPQIIIPQSFDRAAVSFGTSPIATLRAVHHSADLLAEVAAAVFAFDFRGKAGDVVPCGSVFPAVIRGTLSTFFRPAFFLGISAPMVGKLCAVREIKNQYTRLRHGNLRHLFGKDILVKFGNAENFCTFLYEYGLPYRAVLAGRAVRLFL